MSDTSGWDDLRRRFEAVARGRTVVVGPKEWSITNDDFEVAYSEESDSFEVRFTRDGHFEGAYRCLERWIKVKAETLDGVYEAAPAGYVHLRRDMRYWQAEASIERIAVDVHDSLTRTIEWLEHERPGENVAGEWRIEYRAAALRVILSRLDEIMNEVHAGLLAPWVRGFLDEVHAASRVDRT